MENNTGIYPEFFIEAVPDKAATLEQGCPKFRDVEKVRVHIAGDQKNIHQAKVTDEHRKRWPTQYEAFKAGMDAPVNGTPLKEWPLLTTSRIQELLAQNIRTVEDIAELRDSAMGSLGMGARELKKQAVAFLESAKDASYAVKLATELQKRDDANELMQSQINEMSEVISKIKGDKPVGDVLELTKERDEARISATRHQNESEEMSDKLSQSSEEIARLGKVMADYELSANGEITELKDRLAVCVEEIGDTQSENTTLSDKLSQASDEIARLGKIMHEHDVSAARDRAELQKDNTDLTETIARMVTEIADLQENISALKAPKKRGRPKASAA